LTSIVVGGIAACCDVAEYNDAAGHRLRSYGVISVACLSLNRQFQVDYE